MARPYGVLGRVLGHSYTPEIYRDLAGLDYVRFEREPDQVAGFIAGSEWEGTNVTIPYKKVVAGLVDEMTPIARRLGNVNTVYRAPDGHLIGDNTDYYGFKVMAESLGLDIAGKKALVLGGRGGAGTTVMNVLADMGARALAVSRTAGSDGVITYEELPDHADAALLVNATPVGMYPDCPDQPCSLDEFESLEGVLDIVYNPARTGLIMQAERMGIPSENGLLMLVAQAAGAVLRYTGERIPLERIVEVTRSISEREQNIVLIGMPGSGKTCVGRSIARKTGRAHVDMDRLLEERAGMTCERYIVERGEESFRDLETRLLEEVARRSGQVISCGGGVVTREANHALLHQNSRIIMLDRDLRELSCKGRPVSRREGVRRLAEQRMGTYRAWADVVVRSLSTPDETADAALGSLSMNS